MSAETSSPNSVLTRPDDQRATYQAPMPEARASLIRRAALLAIGALLIAGAVAWLQYSNQVEDTGPRLVHVIKRGNLFVTVIEEGMLESSENTEIKCKVRGSNTVTWVIENGTTVKAGDELVRLDTLFIEEQINERSKYAHWSRSGAERSKADVARSELAIKAYDEGDFLSQLMELEKSLAIRESDLLTAKNLRDHTLDLARNGYESELRVEEAEFAVTQAALNVDVQKTQIDVLKQFTRAEQLQTLRGDLTATKARHAANVERAFADASRRDRALEEFEYCVVKADRAGLVIHPNAARWENAPKIEEGSTVHKDQVMLLMPDLSKMQVKIGVHESIVERVKPDLAARVTLANAKLIGKIEEVSSIAREAGWWNGGKVKYDTIVKLPSAPNLKPGMSAEVEIILAVHEDVMLIPVAAVVERGDDNFCWVKTEASVERRAITLGDSNEVFSIVESGLEVGDQVLLQPGAHEEPEQTEDDDAFAEGKGDGMDADNEGEQESGKPAAKPTPIGHRKPSGGKPATGKPKPTKPTAAKPKPNARKPNARKPNASKPNASKPGADKSAGVNSARKPKPTKPASQPAKKPAATK